MSSYFFISYQEAYLSNRYYLTCYTMQVLTRYLLEKLFGPGVAGVTSDQTILYLDLPSNMVSDFLLIILTSYS